jgi:hypothetical protein
MSKLNVRKHLKEIKKFLRVGDWQETSEGLLVHGGLNIRGKYVHTVNGDDERVDYNLIPAEGIAHILNVVFGADSKVANWYLAPYSNNYTPTSAITAQNFHSLAAEIGGSPEGYSQSTRPIWNDSPASAGRIGNVAVGPRATFTIVTASTLAINGAGLLSTNVKIPGSSWGILASATKFSATRTLNNTDSFELGYEVELTDS